MLRDAMCARARARVALHRAPRSMVAHSRAPACVRARARRIPCVCVRVCVYVLYAPRRYSRAFAFTHTQSGRIQLGRDFDSRQLGRNRERRAVRDRAAKSRSDRRDNRASRKTINQRRAIAQRILPSREPLRARGFPSRRIMANNGARPRRCIRLAIIVVPKHVNYTGGYKRQYDRPEAGEASLRPRLCAASPPPTGQSEIISLLKSMRA